MSETQTTTKEWTMEQTGESTWVLRQGEWTFIPVFTRERTAFHVMKAFSNYESKAATLAAEVARLREILKPFARMSEALEAMGGNTPKSGEWHGVHSRAGSVAITIEDMKAAHDALKHHTG